MDRRLLKARAKEILRKQYFKVLIATILVSIFTLDFISFETTAGANYTEYAFGVLNLKIPIALTGLMVTFVWFYAVLTLLFSVLVAPVFIYGLENHLKYVALGQGDQFDIFEGFRHHYGKIVKVNFVATIHILLGLFFLIIPGIIKGYEYRFINQVLEEHPDWEVKQVLNESKRLTYGYKMDLFVLNLSFFGWIFLFGLLDNITIGLASYFLEPYMAMTNAQAYLWLTEKDQEGKFSSVELIRNENTFA